MSSWHIVSNRLPYTYDEEKQQMVPSSGGLVTAIKGIKTNNPMNWIGVVPHNTPDHMLNKSPGGSSDPMDYTPIKLDEGLYSSYYNDFCNDVIWPLFHYEIELVRFNKSAWESYVKTNEIFAEKILEKAKENDVVWIHDFHLMLLPGLLKKSNKNLKVGFFLHIPFPSSEVYKQLPVRKELLEALIAADLIGFHDYSYLRHFASSLYNVLGLKTSMLTLEHNNHITQLGVFPVSIDTQKFKSLSTQKKTEQFIKTFKPKNKEAKVILGVDRLDYIKGIELKLKSIDQLLENHPELVGQLHFIQVAVPSRTGVPEYIKLKEEIERLVGQINGKHSTPNYVPITYLYKSIDVHALIALYQIADVMFIGSKRDGMNLVCLEYIVAQNPRKPGVVVLSEFAGAASTLSHALKVNPWDFDRTSETLFEAINMPLEEKKDSHKEMFKYLESYTGTHWAESFVNTLESRETNQATGKTKPAKEYQDEIKNRLKGKKLAVFLDYDGTIVPIHDKPESAVLDKKRKLRLKKLIQNHKTSQFFVVSGRPGVFLNEQLEDMDIYYSSEHGASLFNPKTKKWKNLVTTPKKIWFNQALKIMNDFATRTPQSFIEKKKFCLAWHYRKSPEDYAEFQARKLVEELQTAFSNLPIQVTPGKKVVEVKPAEANKGFFVNWAIRNKLVEKDETLLLTIGDDKTDEDMFEAVKEKGLAIKVGSEPTRAEYFLKSQDEVFDFLDTILN